MAVGNMATRGSSVQSPGATKYTLPMVLMVSLYFSIGFITALNDILVPHFKDLFHLTNVLALLVQFCFFGAYFVMSIPSGIIVGRIGYKAGIIAALCTMACGLFIFVPASIVISYPVFLFALFVVGSGLALLQVAINPYVGALGKSETAATRISICGFFNSFATNRAPKIGAALIFVAAGATSAELARSVRLPYVALGCFTLLLALVTAFVPLPDVLNNEPVDEAGAVDGHAWSFRHLRLGSFAIFAYVGAEVAIGSIMINFLGQPSMGGFSHIAAATYVSYYWGAAMVGRGLGSLLLPFFRTERALAVVSLAALVLISGTIFGHGHLALWATVSCGLFNSVMWPCIFPLSVKGLGKFTSQGSGLLVMMVVGGAVIPELQGLLADKFGYQHSFVIVLICYAYIVFFALSGYRVRQPRLASAQDYVPAVEI